MSKDKWIDTRDMLPESDGHYLIRFYSVSKLNSEPKFQTREATYRDGKWFTIGHYFSWDVLSDGKVTFWMPMIEAPNDWQESDS